MHSSSHKFIEFLVPSVEAETVEKTSEESFSKSAVRRLEKN